MRRTLAAAAALALALGLTACNTAVPSGPAGTATGFYDSSTVHSISVTVDETAYAEMLQTYAETGDKEWISATVVVDGVTYENAGIKLKGNSSLRGLAQALAAESGDASGEGQADDGEATAGQDGVGGMGGGPGGGLGGGPGGDLSPEEPEGLPWRIKLDEYVDGQNHEGETDFVIRGSSSETALNEALALEMLDEAGLATQQASSTRFSVNGSEEELRLVVQNPDDQSWYEETVDDNGVLFKAESGGDYNYRGSDYTAYVEAFDLEANPEDLTDEEAYQPLIELLGFIDDADDETFAAELGSYLDVDSFAEYLAIEELLGNTDDIDGPGNNAYLAYDPDTGLFTVIAWDHNLALGSGMGGGGFGGEMPEGFTPPEGGGFGGGFGGGGGAGGPGSQSNPLVRRFQENEEFAALIDAASARLRTELIDSGYASEALAEWTAVLLDQASDLVDAETIRSESDAVARALTSAGSEGGTATDGTS